MGTQGRARSALFGGRRLRQLAVVLAALAVIGQSLVVNAPPVVATVDPAAQVTTLARRADGGATQVAPAPVRIGATAGSTAGDPSIAGPVRTDPGAKPPPDRTEVPAKRTESSQTFANPDGSSTLVVSTGRVNYRDPAGAWQPTQRSSTLRRRRRTPLRRHSRLRVLGAETRRHGGAVVASGAGSALGLGDAA